MKLAGHCVRHPEEEASKLVLWQPTIGQARIGRRAVTYIDTLMRDTNLASADELKTAMMDREGWRRRADSKRVETRPKKKMTSILRCNCCKGRLIINYKMG